MNYGIICWLFIALTVVDLFLGNHTWSMINLLMASIAWRTWAKVDEN